MRGVLLRLLAIVVGVALFAGCGSSGAKQAAGGRRLDRPVTVSHRYGSTRIEQVPKRIVTLDLQWTDVILAMGITPVGHSVDTRMPESGVPWQKIPHGSKALSLGDGGVPVEQIAALKPDLIVGTYSIADKQTYNQLSAIAPTIASTREATAVTPWQDLVRLAGRILDKTAKAGHVIESAQTKVHATAAQLPGLKDKTFTLAQYIVGDTITAVADRGDGSSRFFQHLGMRLYRPVVHLGQKRGQARVSVSTERVDLLRADLLAFLINGGDKTDLADIPGFGQLPGTVAVLDYPTIVGLNTPSPLSIPYVLHQLRPYLEKAAASPR